MVVTADHGEEFMEHGRIGHGHALYEELTHVPLVMRLPEGPEGRRIDAPVSMFVAEGENMRTRFPHVLLAAVLSAGLTIAGPAGDGVISVSPLMDPANSQLVENDAMKLYKQKIAQYAEAGTDPSNGIVAYGWTAGAALQHILEQAKAPNRLAVMESARTTTMQSLGLMPDGSKFISNIKDEPQLKELVGGNTAILPVFTSAAQNTFMITGMGLRNQAVKETAFALKKLGIASVLKEGKGPAKIGRAHV